LSRAAQIFIAGKNQCKISGKVCKLQSCAPGPSPACFYTTASLTKVGFLLCKKGIPDLRLEYL